MFAIGKVLSRSKHPGIQQLGKKKIKAGGLRCQIQHRLHPQNSLKMWYKRRNNIDTLNRKERKIESKDIMLQSYPQEWERGSYVETVLMSGKLIVLFGKNNIERTLWYNRNG